MPNTAQPDTAQSGSAQGDVSEEQLDELEEYAEKSRQNDDRDELLERTPRLLERGGIYLIGAAVVITLGLLYFGQVNELVTASGQLVTDGRSVSVPALEAGVVTEVRAQPGDRLRKGAPLLRLDEEQSGPSLAALQRRLRLQRERLEALRADSVLVARVVDAPRPFLRTSEAEPETGTVLQLLSDLRLAWMGRQDAVTRTTEQLPQQREQTQREIELARERIEVLEENYDAARTELTQARATLEETRALADSGYVSRAALRQEESSVRSKEQRVAQLRLDLSNQRIRLNDLQMQLNEQSRSARKQRTEAAMDYEQSLERLRQGARDLHTRLREQAATVQDTREEIQAEQRERAQATVTSPVAGTVARMAVASAGELVNSGQVVAVVVPTGEPVVGRVNVPNKDIGTVEEGQPVNLKVDAYPHQQFGTVPGRVENVFPNTGQSSSFTVEVTLLHDYLVADGDTVDLFPGLTVEADIVAGEQRLLSLLLSQNSGQSGGGS